MAEDISLKLEERTVLGKQVRQLRRDGFIPAVIHDHGKPSVHVMVNSQRFIKYTARRTSSCHKTERRR